MNYFEDKACDIFNIVRPHLIALPSEFDSIVEILKEVALAGRMDSHIAGLAMNGGSDG